MKKRWEGTHSCAAEDEGWEVLWDRWAVVAIFDFLHRLLADEPRRFLRDFAL